MRLFSILLLCPATCSSPIPQIRVLQPAGPERSGRSSFELFAPPEQAVDGEFLLEGLASTALSPSRYSTELLESAVRRRIDQTPQAQ